MDDLTNIVTHGPSRGIALSIIAVGVSVLIVLSKAVPVYRQWALVILEIRGNSAAQAANFEAQVRQRHEADTRLERRLEALAGEVARLRDDLRLVTDPPESPPPSPTPGDTP